MEHSLQITFSSLLTLPAFEIGRDSTLQIRGEKKRSKAFEEAIKLIFTSPLHLGMAFFVRFLLRSEGGRERGNRHGREISQSKWTSLEMAM